MAICIISPNTKDLTGEYEDRFYVGARGDSRIAITLQRNAYTVVLDRTKRFLVDDIDSPIKLAYTLSKPFKLGHSFNETGVLKFVLQEVQSTEFDNMELAVADYYRYFTKDGEPITGDAASSSGSRWI